MEIVGHRGQQQCAAGTLTVLLAVAQELGISPRQVNHQLLQWGGDALSLARSWGDDAYQALRDGLSDADQYFGENAVQPFRGQHPDEFGDMEISYPMGGATEGNHLQFRHV